MYRIRLMDGFHATSYGDAVAEIYDELFTPDGWEMYGVSETADTVDFLAKAAAGAAALEVGAGTGRIALALADRGVAVTAVEVSAAMVRRLRAKPGGAELAVVHGDFLTVPIPGRFRLIYAVFNTVMAFATQDNQVAFFARAGDLLTRDGVLVIEHSVPPERGSPGLLLCRLTADQVLASAVSYDPASQTAVNQHIVFREEGLRLIPSTVRHIWPSEMDLMARLAGLRMRSRHGGWHHERYAASSKRHVSTYTFGDV